MPPARPAAVQEALKPYPQRVVLAARHQASRCGFQSRDGLLVGAGHGVGELAHDDVAAAEHRGGGDAASARGSCGKNKRLSAQHHPGRPKSAREAKSGMPWG